MSTSRISLNVFFEEPFWVGVFELSENGKLCASKITFGAEPKDEEVYQFILKNFYRLKYSPAVEAEVKDVKISPKRMQRKIKQAVQERGIGTKAQQALKLQYEQFKTERKRHSREIKREKAEQMYALKKQKKKEKHKGR